MFQSIPARLFDDPTGAPALIRRLLTDYGLAQWKRYLLAFPLMAIAAGCTAGSAWLAGDVVNQAYVNRNFVRVYQIGIIVVIVFSLRGLATYGHLVMLSRIGNSIVAENQRRLFSKILQQNLSFFVDRHTAEFTQRLVTGATSATYVLSLLITGVGRDFFTLI